MSAKNGFLGLIILLLAGNLVATVWSQLGKDAGEDAVAAAMVLPLPKIVSAELKEDLLAEFID